MILNISKVYNKGYVENTCNLATSMLAMKATHLFIASNLWESIVIELDDCIPEGYLSCFNMVCSDIKVKTPEKITDVTLRQLVELYPNKAGALRRVFLQGRNVREVIPDCLV